MMNKFLHQSSRTKTSLPHICLGYQISKNYRIFKKATDNFIETWNNGTDFSYLILDRNNNVCGQISLQDINFKNHAAHFGYYLDIGATGKGYISNILKHIEKLAFANDIVRLLIVCDTTNIPSNNIAKRNNYELEGICRKYELRYNHFYDCNQYAKINPKYK